MNSPFNCKIIEYANGIVEIRKYNKVIGEWGINEDKDDVLRSQVIGKKFSQLEKDLCEPEILLNPFTNEEDEYFSEEQLQILKNRQDRSLRNSFSRTINSIYKISRQCEWEYFITLTYDNSKVDRYDYDLCMKKANKWFHNQRRYAKDLQYLFVPEQHKDGAWHIHGVISNVGDMKFIDSGKKFKSSNDDNTIYNLDGWKFGFSTASKVDDYQKVSSYITKYITKDIVSASKGKKRYYRSQNIPEPQEYNLIIESK